MKPFGNRVPSISRRTWGAALAASLVVAGLPSASEAFQFIPSVVFTRPIGSGISRTGAGLAMRTALVPGLVDAELGASYRRETLEDGAITAHEWPLTASLWLSPFGSLYAGGGVGFDNRTLHYADASIPGETRRRFGAHLGGGLRLPIAGVLGIDVQGRYNLLSDQDKLTARNLKPETWSTSVGVALGF